MLKEGYEVLSEEPASLSCPGLLTAIRAGVCHAGGLNRTPWFQNPGQGERDFESRACETLDTAKHEISSSG